MLSHESHSYLFLFLFECDFGWAILNHFYIVCQSVYFFVVVFKIVVQFSLVASPIDVLALVGSMVPMASMTRIFWPKAAHFRLELATLPPDRSQSFSQFQPVLVSMHQKKKEDKFNIFNWD